MLPDVIASRHTPSETPVALCPSRSDGTESDRESLFEHVAWAYVLCREHLFRDDTARMIAVLWPGGRPASGTKLLELGCGPGFYSCRLAEKFRDISVTGFDRSESQLQWARERAGALRLTNCSFERVNALKLSSPAFHDPAGAEPRRGPNLSRFETRWSLFHSGTALCFLGFASTFRNVVDCRGDSI